MTALKIKKLSNKRPWQFLTYKEFVVGHFVNLLIKKNIINMFEIF